MTKEDILLQIQHTTADNGGTPLGIRTFERETGISVSSWRGKYWRNWGDAVKEAGFTANQPNAAHERSFLILSLVRLTQKNKVFPTYADVRLARESDQTFPSHQSISRLGSVQERVELVRQYAKEHPEFSDVLDSLPDQGTSPEETASNSTSILTKEGYVYLALLKIGREKRYKVGQTVHVDRRADQLSIHLPSDLELVHAIRTDDAYGIESYWHKRFEAKNTNGEWFDLNRDDVQAFKKRKFM